MNAPYKKLITAMTLMAVSAFPIAGLASADDIQQRVKKVGRLNIGEAAAPAAASAPAASNSDVAAPAQAASGADLYQANCFACHGTGAAGAPILGNKEAWAPRISQGEDTLIQHAINGLNAMPPRGGTVLSDDELKAVVMHMVESAQ